MTYNLKTKLVTRKQKQQQENKTIPHKKCVVFTHFNTLIRHITNLFRQTNIKIIFHATNTIKQQLTEKQECRNPSGIYKLKCNTCNEVYVGQSRRAINVRYKEHIRYITTNNSTSAYAAHIRRAQVKVGLINLCKGLSSLNARIYYKLKSGT
jgi:hypothetical protein